jgi:hypothetical protein
MTEPPKNERLAQGITDKVPREWLPPERARLYLRGFRDGASICAMREDHRGLVDYQRGYADGCKARQEHCAAFAAEVGYVPNILRTQGEEV